MVSDEVQGARQGLRAAFVHGPSALPSLSLFRSEAQDLCRLRTGVWARMGRAAVIHGETFACPACGEQLSRCGGNIVAHIFVCPAMVPERGDLTAADLWASRPTRLRQVVAYARLFVAAI